MSAPLVPHDDPSSRGRRPRPAGHGAARALALAALAPPATAVRVTSVLGGVRLTFASTDGGTHAEALGAALLGLVDRERPSRDFLQFAVEVHPDGTAVSLTITGPPALYA